LHEPWRGLNARVLTPELRARLKSPLGALFTGDKARPAQEAWALALRDRPVKVIVVGDRVTEDSAALKVRADLYIVDRRIMRRTVSVRYPEVDRAVTVGNPAGRITRSAVEAIRAALASGERTRIEVQGEEDLLTLPAILEAPLGSCVIYGQPREGVVVVKVTEAKKREIQAMVDGMPWDP